MPKMFGFSRRRMKLGRLKGHLHDPFHGSRIPSRQTERFSHPTVPWGKNVILVGGKSDPPYDKITVWSFNTETELWSHMEAKGDIPVSRSGHTVIRAGPVLILFGGEDARGKKLHDLHMFDLL